MDSFYCPEPVPCPAVGKSCVLFRVREINLPEPCITQLLVGDEPRVTSPCLQACVNAWMLEVLLSGCMRGFFFFMSSTVFHMQILLYNGRVLTVCVSLLKPGRVPSLRGLHQRGIQVSAPETWKPTNQRSFWRKSYGAHYWPICSSAGFDTLCKPCNHSESEQVRTTLFSLTALHLEAV